ncbi:hypothetical protein HY489_05235 [Candidatus Woesearchaeota archaeon]|nr:hypothetical protein [Candidatus Woesearchaeota archaeon]
MGQLQKPLVVVLGEHGSYNYTYRDAAEHCNAVVECRANDVESDALLGRASLVFLGPSGLGYAQRKRPVYQGVVLVRHNGEGDQREYKKFGVNELWTGPSVEVLESLVRKYTAPRARILFVEDEEASRGLVQAVLGDSYDLVEFDNALAAKPAIPSVHMAISDVEQQGAPLGVELLRCARRIYDETQLPFVLMSGDERYEVSAKEALFLAKPFNPFGLKALVAGRVPQHLKPAQDL